MIANRICINKTDKYFNLYVNRVHMGQFTTAALVLAAIAAECTLAGGVWFVEYGRMHDDTMALVIENEQSGIGPDLEDASVIGTDLPPSEALVLLHAYGAMLT